MVRVSIDVDAARGVVGSLRSFFDDAMDEWSQVGEEAGRALCSTSPLKALSDPLVHLSHAARDLETRVELAVLVNTGDDGAVPTGGVLSYELSGSGDGMDAVRERLGTTLAAGLADLHPGNDRMSRADVERLALYTSLLEKYEADSLVTDAMFDALGPEGVVQVPIALHALADAYQRDMAGMGDGDLFWDDDTHMTERIAELQQQFMESFGTGLATSSRSGAFRSAHPDFAAELAAQATGTPDGSGWGLSQVLRFGDYDAAFLTEVGEGLYSWEKDQTGPVWGTQLGGDVQGWRLGTDDSGAYYDPFVGLLEAMGRTPRAALDLVNPDGGGTEAAERARYLIEERTWRADDFNALGLALDAAATAFHRPDAPADLQERAAWVAAATVHHLAARDEGRNHRRIGDAAKDSLAHLLSAYIYDVDRIAGGENGTMGTHSPNQNAPWDAGLPMGADFSQEDLAVVLRETLTDTGAAGQLGRATAEWNAYRVAMGVEAWGGEGGDAARLQAAVNRGSALTGFVLGAMDAGLTGEAKAADERVKTYLGYASDVVGLVPTGGTFTSFLAEQALSAGEDRLTENLTGNEARVSSEQHQVREVARTDLEIALAIALAEADVLPAGATQNEASETYAWFQGGAFDADALADPAVRNDFISWLGSGEGGETMTRLLPDIAAEFDRGVERGSGAR